MIISALINLKLLELIMRGAVYDILLSVTDFTPNHTFKLHSGARSQRITSWDHERLVQTEKSQQLLDGLEMLYRHSWSLEDQP